jgi:VanZ family protein
MTLAILTVWLTKNTEPLQSAAPQTSALPAVPSAGTADGAWQFAVSAKGKYTHYLLSVPIEPGKAYWVDAEFYNDSLADRSARKGRLVTVFVDSTSALVYMKRHIEKELTGGQRCLASAGFRAPRSATIVHVGVESQGLDHQVRLQDLKVGPAQNNPFYYWMRFTLLLGWLGLFAFLSLPILLNQSAAPRVFVICTLAIILVGALVPKEHMLELVSLVTDYGSDREARAELVPDQKHGISTLTKAQKVGHLLLFAVLAYAIRMQGQYLGFAIYFCIFLAVGTESVQFFVPGRSPGALDFLVDLVGIAVGLIAWSRVRQYRQRVMDRAPSILQSEKATG